MNRPARFLLLVSPCAILVGLALGGPLSKTAAASEEPLAVPCSVRTVAQLVELEVKDVVPLGGPQQHAVMLLAEDGTILPLFVSEESAVAIAFRLAHRNPPHPLAADLTDSVLSHLGGQVTEVRIDSIQDHIFYGRLFLKQGTRQMVLEARPSDAIALALTGGAKIFATRQVLSEAGITRAEIDKERAKETLPEPRDIPPPALDGGITL